MTATTTQDDDETSLAEKAAADLKRAYATLSKRARRLKRLEAEETLLTALILQDAFKEVLNSAPDPIRESALKILATVVNTQGYSVRGGDKPKTRRRLAAAAVKAYLSPSGFPSISIREQDKKTEWCAAARGSSDLQVGTHSERVMAKVAAEREAAIAAEKAAKAKAEQSAPPPNPAPSPASKPSTLDDLSKVAPAEAAAARAAG